MFACINSISWVLKYITAHLSVNFQNPCTNSFTMCAKTRLLLIAVICAMTYCNVICCTSIRNKARADDLSADSTLWRRPKNYMMDSAETNKTGRNGHTNAEDVPYFVKSNDPYSFKWGPFLGVLGGVFIGIPAVIAVGYLIYHLKFCRRNNSENSCPVTKSKVMDDTV